MSKFAQLPPSASLRLPYDRDVLHQYCGDLKRNQLMGGTLSTRCETPNHATVHWLSRAHYGRRDKEYLLDDREHLVRLRDDDLGHECHGLCDGDDRFRSRHDLLRCRKDHLRHQDPGLREIDPLVRSFDHLLRQ